MKRFLFFIPFFLLSLFCVFFIMSFFSPVDQIKDTDSTRFVRELYLQAEGVYPSGLSPLLESRVSERIKCYSETALQRINACNTQYIDGIVRIGREHVFSAPDLGNFLDHVRFCPIVYSVCMGRHDNEGQCVAMESLCIDGMLDTYWRGSPTR